jgi:septum site-determining protein MinC
MSITQEPGTKEPGAQSNPEAEHGTKGDTLSADSSVLPIPVKINEGKIEQEQNGQRDEAKEAHAGRGVNGVHADGDAPDKPVEDHAADVPADAQAEVEPDAVLETASGEGESDGASSLTDGLSTPRSAVKIKGRPGGVSLELGEGDWDELMLLLEERLIAAEGFFRGGRVLLDVGPRPLVEENLRQVRRLLEVHEMHLAVVRSVAERTLQAAAEVGISTTIEETQESLPVEEPPLIVPDGPPNAYSPSPYASPPDNLSNRPVHFVHRGSLRSGQVLRKTESIVVIGDVNPGAQVVSGGDIMVWGRLRGIAHAGAEGNRRAVVAAIDFVPTQLRIANLTAIAPEPKKARSGGFFFWKKEPERRPEIARVIDGHIVVEPWDEGGKPNGLGVWRK